MMQRLSMPLILLAISLTAGAASAQQSPATAQQDARQAADAVAKKFVASYNAGDAAGVAGLFTTDATYATAAGSVLSGPQAIEKGIAARIKTGWTKESVTVSEAHAVGDAVWLVGEYSIVGSSQNSGKQIAGHFAEVLTRDGAVWRIRMLTANLTPLQDVTGQGAAGASPSATVHP